jgi:uncharacterized protein YjlB
MNRTAEPTVATLVFEDDGSIPNNPLPLLLYRGALDQSLADPAAALEQRFATHGWRGGWRNGIYPFHHYHSTSHEVLGIARGRATVRFGGANGTSVEVEAGDAVVIPAGVGHKNEGASDDLLVVGAYPDGCDYDLCRGRPEERDHALRNIQRVPLPATDPLFGMQGPLVSHWRADAA